MSIIPNTCPECGADWLTCRCRPPESAPPSGSEVPTVEGYYWFSGIPVYKGECWQLVRVFRPMWVDPNQQDLHWQYLDRSGGDDAKRYAVTNFPGKWSGPVLPPNTEYTDLVSVPDPATPSPTTLPKNDTHS